eukprot:Colp12_sorted_trinity150504_noHs@16004
MSNTDGQRLSTSPLALQNWGQGWTDVQEESIPMTSATPAILKQSIHISLTIILVLVYSILGILVLVHLFRIIYYGHNRFSYHVLFLAICFLWSLLRAVTFCVMEDLIPMVSVELYRIVYCLPIVLQFAAFSLLFLYLAQVLHKSSMNAQSRRIGFVLWMGINVMFLFANILCVSFAGNDDTLDFPQEILATRVVITEVLFLLLSIGFAFYIYEVSQMKGNTVLLEAKSTSIRQIVALMSLIVLIFVSRAIYNLVAAVPDSGLLLWGYRSGFVVDRVYVDEDHGYSFVFLSVALLVWEILPTCVVLFFFRVRKPKVVDRSPSDVTINGEGLDKGPKRYFFDNPKRYDSEDEEEGDVVQPLYASGLDVPSLPYNVFQHDAPAYYGSMARSYSALSYSSSRFGSAPSAKAMATGQSESMKSQDSKSDRSHSRG